MDGYCSKSDGSCQCKTGHYGLDCNNTCNNCINNSCEAITGFCTKGCIQGFFGRSCQMICPVNCLNHKCDRDSGNCTQGCVRGFHGKICDQQAGVYFNNICKIKVRIRNVYSLRKLNIFTTGLQLYLYLTIAWTISSFISLSIFLSIAFCKQIFQTVFL